MVKVAILHEGKASSAGKVGSADHELLKQLIEKLSEENRELFTLNRVEFYGMGGKSNFFKKDFRKYEGLLQLIEADQISKALFVMDADNEKNDAIYCGYENTLAAWRIFVTDNLKIHNISDIYITCDPTTQTGYVESLLLSTLNNDQKACIETFLNCSDFKAKGHDKAIFNQIYKMAYPDAPDDLQHAHFYELKQKLRALFSLSDEP